MNDTEFENHVRDLLRPAAPSPDLRERIREDLGATPTRLSADSGSLQQPKLSFLQVFFRDFGWACAGAAAALAVLALLPAKQTLKAPLSAAGETPVVAMTAAAQANTFEHDETTNELVAAQDSEQLVETTDGPAREVHYTYLERHAWSNPHTGARVYLEVPREDVYLLPVSLQ
jgi:hypothetical protein